ncbi:hypothetical protein ACFQ67_21115 [Streptomyces sp. NPDC056488]|uniref:hypothetical protein n=1 Tax=Streptomyces sp. NPDC056488 TaxID=3345836 RepID=UPI0036C952AB
MVAGLVLAVVQAADAVVERVDDLTACRVRTVAQGREPLLQGSLELFTELEFVMSVSRP